MSQAGNVIWARSEGGSLSENAYGVAIDNNNQVILTGQYQGHASIANQNLVSTQDPTTSEYGYDIFISKYDINGVPLWVHSSTGDYEDRGLAVSTDASNNVFLTGQFSDTMTFAGQTFNNNAYNVGFLAKFSPAGQLQFLNTMRAGYVAAYDVEVNADNEVIVTGDFQGNMYYVDGTNHLVTNPFSKKIFILKAANNGTFTWAKALGSDSDVSSRSVSVASNKDILITGYFKCAFTELHQPDALFNSVGFKDPYVIKVSDQGSLIYAKQLGGKLDDEGHGVAIGNGDEVLICGSFTDKLMMMTDPSADYDLTFDNFGLAYDYNDEGYMIYLVGDATRNSFLTNVMEAGIPAYDYFEGTETDSLTGWIIDGSDTIHTCNDGILYYNARTDDFAGPAYDYLWSNGSTNPTILATMDGYYYVTVTRKDQCSAGMDTIYIDVHTNPALPIMNDNLGLAVNESGENYYFYNFCAPASVDLTFSNLSPGTSFEFLNNSGTVLSTSPGPITLNTEGSYYVYISDQYCDTMGYLTVDFDYPEPDTMAPVLALYDLFDYNDSIALCSWGAVSVVALDKLTNPVLDLQDSPDVAFTDYDWTISPAVSHSEGAYSLSFYPTANGWYKINYQITVGYDNLCGIDTLSYYASDSFYVELHQGFQTNLHADNLLCPNGSVYLYTDDTNSDLSWDGPGIVWTSPDSDSVQVTTAGTYIYYGVITDTTLGCTYPFYKSFTLLPKSTPPVASFPMDAIICPNDSVQIAVSGTYVSYNWIGPDGSGIASTINTWVEDIGFYYCEVVDTEGCTLTTTPFELKEYTTPYLSVMPSPAVCDNQPVEITVSYFGDADFQWQAPLSGTGETVTVTQPGIYYVEITQCGFTLSDSVIIVDGSISVSISVADSVLCNNETAVISAPAGMGNYDWTNGLGQDANFTTAEAGDYWVTVTNSYGCSATSDTVHISVVPGSSPPNIADVEICSGADVTLVDNSVYTAQWYDSDTNFVSSGPNFQFNDLTNDTLVLVAYQNTECPPAYELVLIEVMDPLAGGEIIGDSMLCPGETTMFDVVADYTTLEWFIGSTSIGSATPVTVNQTDFAAAGTMSISVQLSNMCYTATVSEPVFFATPGHIELDTDSVVLCFGDELIVSIEGDIASATWSGNFGTAEGDDFELNTSLGNGYIYATATDENGCTTNTDSVLVTTTSFQYDILVSSGDGCIDDELNVQVTNTGDSIIWHTPFGDTISAGFQLSLQDSTAGTYYVELWDQLGCHYVDSVVIDLNMPDILALASDTLMCINELFAYEFPNGNVTYTWDGFEIGTDIPVTVEDQWLVLTVTSPEGCYYQDSIFIESANCNDELPNVFTPNGDGINDFFVIDEALIFTQSELVIVNRWGQVILRERGYRNTFDGLGISDGVYFYSYRRDPDNQPDQVINGFFSIFH